jgi:hypothetical protein
MLTGLVGLNGSRIKVNHCKKNLISFLTVCKGYHNRCNDTLKKAKNAVDVRKCS